MSGLMLGVARNQLKVPLFVELYGYGPFLGRRNMGTRDPLYCRAASFYNGRQRAIIITNDLVVTGLQDARSIRERISAETDVLPQNIMICASHTHSGPAPMMNPGVGWGTPDPEFVKYAADAAVQTAVCALKDEQPVSGHIGKAKLNEKLGYNRVNRGKNITDPEIRFAKFVRDDGSTKLLLHNHGMHGVVFGKGMGKVSADWIGEVARLATEKKLAEEVMFLLGACGDINTNPCCLDEQTGEPELKRVGKCYVDDLEKSFSDTVEMSSVAIHSDLRCVELPTEYIPPETLRRYAEQLIEKLYRKYPAERLFEIALFMEHGGDTQVSSDFQVMRIGNLLIYTVPGELFVELGFELLNLQKNLFPMVACVTNGDLTYIPTRETFDRFPHILDGLRECGYGYYETNFTNLGRFRQKFTPEIGEVVIDILKKMGNQVAASQ